jgi:hypothetical protein
MAQGPGLHLASRSLFYNLQCTKFFRLENLFTVNNRGTLFSTRVLLSQGQLLESRLLDTFFEKVICSTEKCQMLDKKKYVVRVPRVNFEQLIKKVKLLEISSR